MALKGKGEGEEFLMISIDRLHPHTQEKLEYPKDFNINLQGLLRRGHDFLHSKILHLLLSCHCHHHHLIEKNVRSQMFLCSHQQMLFLQLQQKSRQDLELLHPHNWKWDFNFCFNYNFFLHFVISFIFSFFLRKVERKRVVVKRNGWG